ncbi:MAG TPA: CoA transferase [Candidatus Binataceae bacterium]|nr:CoA transferase [Candidatus Binataceae bacterium]
MDERGVLAGIRVIDCGTYVAGPAAATIMSDFGADVIKIERPGGGDLWRLFSKLPGVAKCDLDWCWVLTNRNKKSVALDLGRPEGREALLRLVGTADVFLTNYQRTLLEKFRLTWEDLSPHNPKLIYAHLTGYGDSGEDADAPAFDALAYWARSGLMMSVTGIDGSPGAPRPGMGDHPTAMSMFGAIMLGLYRRERTGKGSRVTTSLLASGAWANACDIQAKLLDAQFPQRTAGGHPPNPLTAAYVSRDGKLFLLVLIDPDNEFPRLCRLLEQPELAETGLFHSNAAREENAAALYEILRSQFEARDLADWASLFRRSDIKWAPLPRLDDVVNDPQMRAAEAFIGLEHPKAGSIETVNSPIFVSGEAKRKPLPAPEVGAHTAEILRELGYTGTELEKLLRSAGNF